MKKITILFTIFCLTGMAYGQVTGVIPDAPGKDNSVSRHAILPKAIKGNGDIIWQTSFNWADPTQERGWTLPAGWVIGENTDNGNLWTWRNDTLKGRRTVQPAPAFFATGDDGFIAVPMDEYNYRDGVTTAVIADTYIQTPPINCTAASSVVVKFSQYFRLCCSDYNLDMLVTNDGGVHWATYGIRYGVSGNNYTTDRFQNVEINISDVAAGLANVQIRFYMHGMAYYFWMIDDLTLAEAYDNDIRLEDYWMDFDGGSGATVEQINYWPLSQMGMAGETSGTVGNLFLKGALLNNGKADAEDAQLNVKILKNGTEIRSDFSPANTIWTLERDTAQIPDPFLATDYGDYRFDFSTVSANVDEVPANNIASMHFTVNDSLGHRADFSPENFKNTGNWSGGGWAGDMVSVDYQLYTAGEINSLTATLGTFTAAENPQFQFVLYKSIEDVWEEWMITEVMDMDSSLMYKSVTLPVSKDGETEFLEPGNYKACVRMWGTVEGSANGSQGMNVGLDLTTKYGGCGQYYNSDGAWHTLAGAPLFMIGFNMKGGDGPTHAPVTFNVDLNMHIANGEFHPGSDQVAVKGYASSWNGTASMTDSDGDGIYTVTVDALAINSNLEYKYMVNGVEEAYPTGGNLHRNYVVRYWNVLNDKFNNGVTTGIPSESLTASFQVYPNPCNGRFTVSLTNKVPATIDISLVNLQGQVLFTNLVTNVTTHTEIIDQQLSKGIYFLRINNGAETQVQKVVVN